MKTDLERYLSPALIWKYGHVADTAGDEITAWRHDTLPEPVNLAALVTSYMADELPNVLAARELKKNALSSADLTDLLKSKGLIDQADIDARKVG